MSDNTSNGTFSVDQDDISVMITRIDGNVTRLLEAHLDHERRLRSLERFRAWAAGVGATIGAWLGLTTPLT